MKSTLSLDVMQQIVTDPRLSPAAVRVIMHVAMLGKGTHDVSRQTLQILLKGGEQPTRAAIREGALAGWMSCVEDRGPASYVLAVYVPPQPELTASTVDTWRFADRTVPKDVRALVLERDCYRCTSCGSGERLHIDHIKPFSWGGDHSASNLRVLCATCNCRRGAARVEL